MERRSHRFSIRNRKGAGEAEPMCKSKVSSVLSHLSPDSDPKPESLPSCAHSFIWLREVFKLRKGGHLIKLKSAHQNTVLWWGLPSMGVRIYIPAFIVDIQVLIFSTITELAFGAQYKSLPHPEEARAKTRRCVSSAMRFPRTTFGNSWGIN